ncbi:MAG: flagellar biosynthetic protein FliO [Planctomycetaceae bacterium]|jgi:flagellar biogenesis protein FliO|nr:flagellar biosynthetic protein FliO [Planctomycetaceae bacterium]
MPHLRILIILIVAVVSTGISGMLYLVAEEQNRPFPARPSASFVTNNFTKTPPPSLTSAPIPPKSSDQLRHVREALSTTQTAPPYQSPQQPNEQPVQTANIQSYGFSPVQQVAAVEPVPPSRKSAPYESIETPEPIETPENTTIESQTKITAEKQNNQLLDKPIGSAKTENNKRLINRPKIANAITPLIPVLGSLLIVIGAFFILVFFLRKVSPKSNRLLPKEAFEDLGRAVLTQKIQLHLLRLGNRLLLVSITPEGVAPITEITDPDEVVPLLGLCRQLDTHSSTEFFRKTLSSFSTGGTEGGYFGTDAANVNKINAENRKNSLRNNQSKQSAFVDLYSEPDESLAEILAKRGQHG